MVRCLAGRGCSIVAGKAGTNDIGMIDTYDRCPASSTVTVFTQGAGLYVGRVFAGGGAAVVTTGTTAGDAVVVEDRTRPAIGVVAIVAGVTGSKMVRCLAGRRGAIVAGKAGAKHSSMIDSCDRCPASSTVTVFAKICSLNVSRRFSCSSATVMAAETVTTDLAMIKARTLPATCRVTVFAVIAAANVA